jgi:hypothetical protein
VADDTTTPGVILWELRKDDCIIRCRSCSIEPAGRFVDLEIIDGGNVLTVGRLDANMARRFADRFRESRSAGWILFEGDALTDDADHHS